MEPLDVVARGSAFLQKDIEDVVFVDLRFPGGKLAHVHVSWLDPHKLRKFTVVGTQKMVVFDDMEASEKIKIYDKGVDRAGEVVSYGDALTVRNGDILIPKISLQEPLKLECSALRRVRPRPQDAAHRRARRPSGRQGARRRAEVAQVAAAPPWRSSRCRRRSREQRDPSHGAGRRGHHVGRVLRRRAQRAAGHRLPDREPRRDPRRHRQVGNDVRIDDHASLGKLPMKAANSATTKEQELPPLTVGDVCIVGTGVVLYRGAAIDAKVLMADLSTVRENVTVGRGTIVGRGVTIENFCSVGRYCKLESESYLCAYSTLEDRVFVAPGVVTSNDNFVGRTQERFKHFKGVTVKKGGRIGACSVTLPGRGRSARTRWSRPAPPSRRTSRRACSSWASRPGRSVPYRSNNCWKTRAGWTRSPALHPYPHEGTSMSTQTTQKVPLLDLRAQYDTIRTEVDEAVKGVMESCHFIGGPEVGALEQEVARYSQTAHAVACASGTDAILLALWALGIGPGDEVISPAYTFFATAGTIAQQRRERRSSWTWTRARTTWTRTCSRRRSRPRTKAVVAVSLFGQCCDLPAIKAICDKHQIYLIEDAAQSIGSEWEGKRSGSTCDFGTFSFFPSKNLGGAGDGGMIVTQNAELAEKARLLCNHGAKPEVLPLARRHELAPRRAAGRHPAREAAPPRPLEREARAERRALQQAVRGLQGRPPVPRRAHAPHLQPVRDPRARTATSSGSTSARGTSAARSTTRCRCTCRSASRTWATRPATCRSRRRPRWRRSRCPSTRN